jgi:hypothetical protein
VNKENKIIASTIAPAEYSGICHKLFLNGVLLFSSAVLTKRGIDQIINKKIIKERKLGAKMEIGTKVTYALKNNITAVIADKMNIIFSFIKS